MPEDGKSSVNTTFFSEMLQSIADRGRALIQRREPSRERSAGLLELCEALLSGRGEASGVALAQEILAEYADLTTGPRIAFFETLARTFGHDQARIDDRLECPIDRRPVVIGRHGNDHVASRVLLRSMYRSSGSWNPNWR